MELNHCLFLSDIRTSCQSLSAICVLALVGCCTNRCYFTETRYVIIEHALVDNEKPTGETLKLTAAVDGIIFAISAFTSNKLLQARVKPPVGGQEGGSKGRHVLYVGRTSGSREPLSSFFFLFSTFFEFSFFISQHRTQTLTTFPGFVGREMVGRGRTRQTRVWNQGH